MKNFILAHGFGFNNNYWSNLVPALDGNIFYYGDKIDENKQYIGIGHSLGFFKLNGSAFRFTHLICLQGFVNFCGNNAKLRFIRGKFLHDFIKAFADDSQALLNGFYKKCGEVPKNIQDREVSFKDLQLMFDAVPHCGVRTSVVCDVNDKIVPKIIVEDNFRNFDQVSIRYIDENAGHLLGYKNPEIIIEAIHNEITDKE